MHARSALFDVLGDHVRPRGGQAPVSALVRMLAPLGVSAAAVRTAVSRMVRQGWLSPVRTPAGPGYALTDRARVRLDGAAARIYRTRDVDDAWDGVWDLLVVAPVRTRPVRERVRAELSYLGYAPLDGDTWVAARPVPGVEAALASEGVTAHRFRSRPVADPGALAGAAWHLKALATAYDEWRLDAQRWVAESGGGDADDEQQFALRSRLVHEWRKFLFRDPGLPPQLLPPDWAGRAAAAFFDREADRLAPAAGRFVDACLDPRGATP